MCVVLMISWGDEEEELLHPELTGHLIEFIYSPHSQCPPKSVASHSTSPPSPPCHNLSKWLTLVLKISSVPQLVSIRLVQK